MKFQLILMILAILLNVASAHRSFLQYKRIQRGLGHSRILRTIAMIQAKQRLLRFQNARF